MSPWFHQLRGQLAEVFINTPDRGMLRRPRCVHFFFSTIFLLIATCKYVRAVGVYSIGKFSIIISTFIKNCLLIIIDFLHRHPSYCYPRHKVMKYNLLIGSSCLLSLFCLVSPTWRLMLSVQYNGELLPDMILTVDYHWGTRLKAMKRFLRKI